MPTSPKYWRDVAVRPHTIQFFMYVNIIKVEFWIGEQGSTLLLHRSLDWCQQWCHINCDVNFSLNKRLKWHAVSSQMYKSKQRLKSDIFGHHLKQWRCKNVRQQAITYLSRSCCAAWSHSYMMWYKFYADGSGPITAVCIRVGSGTVEQVVQEFETGSNDPESQVRTTEVGAAGEACKCSERSGKADTDRRADDHVVLRGWLPPSSCSSFLTVRVGEHCALLLFMRPIVRQCDLLAILVKRFVSGLNSGCRVTICCFWYAVRSCVNTWIAGIVRILHCWSLYAQW